MHAAVVNGEILGETNEGFDFDNNTNDDEEICTDRQRKGVSFDDTTIDVEPTTNILNVDNDLNNGEGDGALTARRSGREHGRVRPEAVEELDICEIDYEADQMCDNDDLDEDEEDDDNDEKIADDDSNKQSEEYTPSSSDVCEMAAGKSGRRRCRVLFDCLAEARINCSKFGRTMRREAKGVREDLEKNLRCSSDRQCCTVEKVGRRLPIMKWLPKYRSADLQGDLLAGFTVGLTAIPQSIAYAGLAGLPPQYGLYSSFIGSFIYVFFGTSKDITLGPSAIQSLLTASFAMSPIAGDPTYAILLGLFTGIVQLGMYCLGLGAIVDFIPFPVLKAFTAAAAITIAMSQVKSWFGLKGVPRDFLSQLYWTFKKIPETRLYDFLLGCVCIFFIVLLKKLREMQWKQQYSEMSLGFKILRKSLWLIGIARNVIVIIVASVVAYIFWENGMRPFTLTGYIPPGIPSFHIPAFSVVDPAKNVTHTFSTDIGPSIGVGFIVTPILGLLEAMAIGKPFARKGNYKIDANQELLPYGIANVLGAFVGGYPVDGTFSRTALNAASGVRTPAGGIVTGTLVLLALQFLTPLFFYIPSASLAVVIILAVLDMITFHKVLIFWKTKKIDLIPWLVTFVSSFVISIAYGVFVGMAVSLLLLIYPVCRPKIEASDVSVTDVSGIRVIRLNTGLSYPACEYFKEKIIKMATVVPRGTDETTQTRALIVNWTTVATADSTTVQMVRELLEELNKQSILVVFCSLQKSVDDLFRRARPRHFHSVENEQSAIDFIRAKTAPYNGDIAEVSFRIPDPEKQRQSGDASSATDDRVMIQVNVDPIESYCGSSNADKKKPVLAAAAAAGGNTSNEFGRSHQYLVSSPGGATEQNRSRVTEHGVQGRYVKS